MERHSKGVVKNLCYAHIFFTELPERTEYEKDYGVLSVDVVSDHQQIGVRSLKFLASSRVATDRLRHQQKEHHSRFHILSFRAVL